MRKCSCEKLNGYLIRKCAFHYAKRKTIFQLYKEARKKLATLGSGSATDSADATDNSAMVEICSKNICEYCMHGNTKPIRCIFFENCGGFNGFKHFIGRKLHQ